MTASVGFSPRAIDRSRAGSEHIINLGSYRGAQFLMSQCSSLKVLPPECTPCYTYFTTVLKPRLCENSNPISVSACNFFLIHFSNTVRIQNTHPIPREYYLHHLVPCDMVDTIPDSGMSAVHITPCTSAPSGRKSGYRPIRCLTVAFTYRLPPQPTREAACQIPGVRITIADRVDRANAHVMTRYHLRNVMMHQTSPLLLQYNALIVSTMKFLLSTSVRVSMGPVKKK